MRHTILAGLGLALLPGVARAQRVEVAFFGGQYIPSPASSQSGSQDVCDQWPCPSSARFSMLSGGPMFGGRVTLPLRARHAIDIVFQTSSVVHTVESDYSPDGSEDVRYLLFSVLPQYQVPFNRVVEAVIAGGMTFGVGSAVMGDVPDDESLAGWWSGLSLSGALRAGSPNSLRVELHGTFNAYFMSQSFPYTYAFMWGIGGRYALPRSNE